jgi:hypothetical protein
MANSKIDFSTLTDLIPIAVNKLSELIKVESLEYGDLMQTISIIENVDVAKKIGFLGALNAIGMTSANSGCAYNTITGAIETVEKTWDPGDFDTKLTLCADEIKGTIAELSLKKGVNYHDMTDTEYLDLFEEALEIAINEMYWRIVWYGDKDAACIDDSPAGYITSGVDCDLLNMIDGLWKRARTIIGTTPAQRITIAANALTTTADQNAAFTKALALEYANNIYFNAPIEIQSKMLADGFEARCTVAFFNKLIQNFQGFELESMRTDLENGLFSIRINGIPFIPVKEWDEMINTYENLGAYKRDPFRCIAYEKTNALVGVPSMTTWGMFKSTFSEETDMVYIKLRDKIDALFLHDNMVMVAI